MFVTGRPVFAGRDLTVRDVISAVLAGVAAPAGAAVVVDQVGAGGVVSAGLNLALVDVHLAGNAGEAGVVAVAGEHVDPVSALAPVLTRIRGTVVNVHLAVPAIVARGAFAGVVVDPVMTDGSVEAGISRTLVNVELAVSALKIWDLVESGECGCNQREWLYGHNNNRKCAGPREMK